MDGRQVSMTWASPRGCELREAVEDRRLKGRPGGVRDPLRGKGKEPPRLGEGVERSIALHRQDEGDRVHDHARCAPEAMMAQECNSLLTAHVVPSKTRKDQMRVRPDLTSPSSDAHLLKWNAHSGNAVLPDLAVPSASTGFFKVSL